MSETRQPLFHTVSGKPIYDGDSYWCFYDGHYDRCNMVRASVRHDYNDGKPRFADKVEAREAWQTMVWLNGPELQTL